MPDLRTSMSYLQVFLREIRLQARFFLIACIALLLFSIPLLFVFHSAFDRFIQHIGSRVIEKQVLYDKARILKTLMQELGYARQLADNVVIRRWAKNEQNPHLRRDALAELEGFRHYFKSGSYFVALAESGNYYYDDSRGSFIDQPLRYKMNSTNPENSWFYTTIKSQPDYQININPDKGLGVLNVWINVLLKDDGRVLGVVGTGIDLTDFIRDVTDTGQAGVTDLFVDKNGAIQIFNDVNYIDMSSISKAAADKQTLDLIFNRTEDRIWFKQIIAHPLQDSVSTRMVNIGKKQYLAAVTALPEIGWSGVTLMDLDIALPRNEFYGPLLGIGIAMLAAILVMAGSLQYLVLKPVARLRSATERISKGDFRPDATNANYGELSELTSEFWSMTDSIHKKQDILKNEVSQKSAALTDAQIMLQIALQQEKEGRIANINLLALIAHEARNPMAVIGNSAQMLKALAVNEKPAWLPRIEKIMLAVQELAKLMERVLAEDHITQKHEVLKRQRGELNAFCALLQKKMQAESTREIIFEPCSASLIINVDWHLIEIAVTNLIRNACKYSPEDSAIHLRTSPGEEGGVNIDVSDMGEPISTEWQEIIFEQFTRRPEDANDFGMGLGLYLVRWITQLHNGCTNIISRNEGNTFRITLH